MTAVISSSVGWGLPQKVQSFYAPSIVASVLCLLRVPTAATNSRAVNGEGCGDGVLGSHFGELLDAEEGCLGSSNNRSTGPRRQGRCE